MHPFANLAGVYKSGFAEYVHMVRKSRLPDSEFFQQLAAAFFAARFDDDMSAFCACAADAFKKFAGDIKARAHARGRADP